jgi:hypothetical protein
MTPVFTGGARQLAFDFLNQNATHVELLYGSVLILAIAFVKTIPTSLALQTSTILGKSLLFGILLLTLTYTSWIHGLLFVIFAGLLLSTAPRMTETFVDNFSFKLVDSKKKWWVEEILNENPAAIEDEKVTTQAVQDDNQTRSQDTKSTIM